MCDFDICLECKNVLEKRSQVRRAKIQRALVGRAGRVEVSDVVCLKSLCDKVAQIQLAKKRPEKRTVSVGVNTERSEGNSSQCLAVVKTETETETETETDEDLPATHEESAGRNTVEVHLLPNGHCAAPDSDKKYENPLIDQIRKLHGEETGRSNSYSCSVSFKDPPSLLSRLRLTGSSLTSMSASPDIFHLRAPLVSWENFMTPSVSDETLAEL